MARFDYLRSDGTAAFSSPIMDRPLVGCLVPTLLACLAFAPFVDPLPLLIGAPVASPGVAQSVLGRRLGGHTGDSYGAVLVLTEAITLLAAGRAGCRPAELTNALPCVRQVRC
jgi:adenosylcobinamide-GDP ribazoletransferase